MASAAFAVVILASSVLTATMVVFVALHHLQLLGLAFAGKVAQLGRVALFKNVLHIHLDLLDLIASVTAIVLASVINQLKILGKSLKGPFTKFTTGAYVSRHVALMEGHIEPFYLKTCTGHNDVAHR